MHHLREIGLQLLRANKRLAGVLGAALLLVACGGGNDGDNAGTTATAPTRATPVQATPEDLKALSQRLDRPIFWIGAAPNRTLELTQTSDGSVYIRYLEKGVAIGDPDPEYLTVGTYPQDDPFGSLQTAAKKPGAIVEQLEDKGIAVSNRARPGSVFFAFPDSEQVVEVFSKDPSRAKSLVLSGRVVPI